MPDGKRIDRMLPVKLTDQEQRDKGKALAHVFSEYRQTQQDKKDAAAKYKELEQAQLEQVEILKDIVASGYEQRVVTCQWDYDFGKGKRTLHRMDTGEVLETSAIPQEELQADLGFAS